MHGHMHLSNDTIEAVQHELAKSMELSINLSIVLAIQLYGFRIVKFGFCKDNYRLYHNKKQSYEYESSWNTP